MIPMKKLWKKLWKSLTNITVVDRFLLIFLALLFGYMTVHLLGGKAVQGETSTIDVMVRTSAVTIFGYFVSGNFMKSQPAQQTLEKTSLQPLSTSHADSESQSSSPVNQIGFQTAALEEKEELGKITISEDPGPSKDSSKKLQIKIIAVIGLVSLGILFLAGNFPKESPELTAIVSQLRDFLFASIGFLVSCGKQEL